MKGPKVPEILAVDGWQDVAVRAIKTAVQVFFGIVTADALLESFNPSLLHEGAVSALGAGASVVMNAVLAWARS